MGFAITTGDSADNQQLNETQWVLRLLEGGTLDPNSGSADPAAYAGCPPGTPGPAEAARYTGVQDYSDYAESPEFYDPNQPTASATYTKWPAYPGLLDRAERPFTAAGLEVPSYVAFGNHDGLVQGNQAANRAIEDVATGCVKPIGPFPDLRTAFSTITPAYLGALFASNPGQTMLVPPDPARRFVSKAQYKAVEATGAQRDAHGFAFVDPAENRASGGAAGYYAWNPAPGFRFIALDTLSEGGVTGPSADGNIDDPQFRWLEGELRAATAEKRLIVLFGHHPVRSLTANVPDEAAPKCSAPDTHGHDTNPGCDVDPRSSTPIHLGGDLVALLHRYPRVVALVSGHTHENLVTPFPRVGGRRVLGHRDGGRGRLALAEPPARDHGQPRRDALDLRHRARPRRADHAAGVRHLRERLRRRHPGRDRTGADLQRPAARRGHRRGQGHRPQRGAAPARPPAGGARRRHGRDRRGVPRALAPRSVIARRTLPATRSGLRASGVSTDRDCAGGRRTKAGRVARVYAAVGRIVPGGCRFLRRDRRFTARRSCRRPLYARIPTRYDRKRQRTTWTLRRRVALPRGALRPDRPRGRRPRLGRGAAPPRALRALPGPLDGQAFPLDERGGSMRP